MGLVEKTFGSCDVIIKEGASGKSFFKLLKGKAGVYSNYGKKDQLQLGTIETGEYFGEMAILEEYPRSATIVAQGAAQVIEIPAKEMKTYFAENPSEVLELMRQLIERISSMTNDYEEAKSLLKEVRDTEDSKKKSLFSKIKKQVNAYQLNKNKITEPSQESLRLALRGVNESGPCNIESFKKGAVIFKEGQVDEHMYILHGGIVGMYEDYGKSFSQRIVELMSVSFFGEMGLVYDDPRTATAVAESDGTRVEIISKKGLEALAVACPVKVEMILRNLSYRLRKLNVDFLITCKEITEAYSGKGGEEPAGE